MADTEEKKEENKDEKKEEKQKVTLSIILCLAISTLAAIAVIGLLSEGRMQGEGWKWENSVVKTEEGEFVEKLRTEIVRFLHAVENYAKERTPGIKIRDAVEKAVDTWQKKEKEEDSSSERQPESSGP